MITIKSEYELLEELAEKDLDIPYEIIIRARLETKGDRTGLERFCNRGWWCESCSYEHCLYRSGD